MRRVLFSIGEGRIFGKDNGIECLETSSAMSDSSGPDRLGVGVDSSQALGQPGGRTVRTSA